MLACAALVIPTDSLKKKTVEAGAGLRVHHPATVQQFPTHSAPFIATLSPTPSTITWCWHACAGRPYSIWKVTDLDQTSHSLFLFGAAHADFWKESPGTLIALFGAKVRLLVQRCQGMGVAAEPHFGAAALNMLIRGRPSVDHCDHDT